MVNMVKVGLLGCGTVGSGVVELLEKKPFVKKPITIEKILVRNMEKHLNTPYSKKLTNSFEDIINSDIDIVVEVMGGLEPAYHYVKQSLLQGRHVVTANKELIAKHGDELQKIARFRKVRLLYEASVGGGIPVIKPLRECLAANDIKEVCGIVNGTTNYILSQMHSRNRSFEEALREAQEKGYAEADPRADVEGYDAARKLAILCSIAFHKKVDCKDIYREGIANVSRDDIQLAKYLGYTVKLLAVGRKYGSKIMARVSPVMLSTGHPLAQVGNVYNAIIVKGDAVGDVLFYGQGAGKLPTASAVVGDIIDIVKNSMAYNSQIPSQCGDISLPELPQGVVDVDGCTCKFLVRVKPRNRHLAMGAIASTFDSCSFIVPDGVRLGKHLEKDQLVFITGNMKEGQFKKNISHILSGDSVERVVNIMRIEEEV